MPHPDFPLRPLRSGESPGPEGGRDRRVPNAKAARGADYECCQCCQYPVPSVQFPIGDWRLETGNISTLATFLHALFVQNAKSQARKCCTNVAFGLPGVVVDSSPYARNARNILHALPPTPPLSRFRTNAPPRPPSEFRSENHFISEIPYAHSLLFLRDFRQPADGCLRAGVLLESAFQRRHDDSP